MLAQVEIDFKIAPGRAGMSPSCPEIDSNAAGSEMPYPTATDADVAFFHEHGWITVADAVDPADLATLEERCEQIIENKESMAFDWAWEKGKSRDERDFRILQSSPSVFWPDFAEAPFRVWAEEFASALMGTRLEFWYDQFLAKPPQKSVATRWHQDEGYWGRLLDGRGITCWMPFHDVDPSNGCMHFIDGGHHDGVLEHENPADVQSDLLACEPDESRAVAVPVKLGGVTFHHSKTPHMTTANSTDRWRKILTQHLKAEGVEGEGDHYPWKVIVNQVTGERIKPGVT
jgi:ectoine hydroxylase-related dioxygenase (phytanoyl-CoA dioxygenase family)